MEPLYGDQKAYSIGEVVGTSTRGSWFNWHGRRAECDHITWEAPDHSVVTVGLVIPCPKCGFPLMVKALPGTFAMSEDGQLSFNALLACPAHWQDQDEQGNARIGNDGRPRMVRCGWTGVIRDGLAHHPQCPALRGSTCQCGATQAQ